MVDVQVRRLKLPRSLSIGTTLLLGIGLLTAVAALGILHVERNGHHYFRGLEHLPRAEAKAALEAHPDLYEPFENSARLLIRNGCLNVASLQGEGFGYGCELSLEERLRLEDWSCSM